MFRTQIFRWHKTLMDDRGEIEDEARSGRPNTTRNDKNVVRVRELVRADRCIPVRMIANELTAK